MHPYGILDLLDESPWRCTPARRCLRGEPDAPGVSGSRFRVGVHAPDAIEAFARRFEDFVRPTICQQARSVPDMSEIRHTT